jgi:hypothetical protein
MQRALVRRVSGEYIDLIACDAYHYDVNQYDCTTNLYSNTTYSPELVQLLNATYTHWVLIFSEEDALLVTYNDTGCILILGEFADIIDWAREVANRAPSKIAYSPWCATLAYLFDVTPFLDYLHGCNFIPQLSGCETLHLVQADNGVGYWGCFLPTTYLQ